jgi:hypothetical protein
LAKALVPSFDEVARRLQIGPPWKDDACPVERLKGVDERGTVGFGEDVVTDLNHIVRAEAEEVAIEGRMMERAEGDSVSDEWLPSRVRVGNDMRRVEKFLVTQAAERALTLVRLEYPFAKSSLMESEAHHGSRVEPTCCVSVLVELIDLLGGPQTDVSCIVDGHGERESAGLVGYDEDRPGSEVPTRGDPVEIGKGQAPLHRKAEASIIGMLWVGSAVPIPKKPVWTEGIVVRTSWRGGN